MFNLMISGTIGSDAVLKTINTANGQTAVANFSVAVKSSKKGADGKPTTVWVDCALWGKRAEALAQYLTKGTIVDVTGEPASSHYSKDGGIVNKLEISSVSDINLLGGGQKASQSTAQPMGQPTGQPMGQPGFTPAPTSFNDEPMPF